MSTSVVLYLVCNVIIIIIICKDLLDCSQLGWNETLYEAGSCVYRVVNLSWADHHNQMKQEWLLKYRGKIRHLNESVSHSMECWRKSNNRYLDENLPSSMEGWHRWLDFSSYCMYVCHSISILQLNNFFFSFFIMSTILLECLNTLPLYIHTWNWKHWSDWLWEA